MRRLYLYVGPKTLLEHLSAKPQGAPISNVDDLAAWLDTIGQGSSHEPFTFVIDRGGRLLVADRHSEHVACAGGAPVLSAGEITFTRGRDGWEVAAVTNQSTGYCPEPESWPAVADALDRAGIAHPASWTATLVFRKCTRCGERNVVKDDWFVCDLCGADLPADWNFDAGKT